MFDGKAAIILLTVELIPMSEWMNIFLNRDVCGEIWKLN